MEFSSGARTFSQSMVSEQEQSCFDRDSSFSTIIQSTIDEVAVTEAVTDEDQCSSNDERNIVKFGQFSGKVEIVVRLKRTEDLDGPKVSIETDMGSLLLFLSPRQLHLLLELANGLASPDTEDHR